MKKKLIASILAMGMVFGGGSVFPAEYICFDTSIEVSAENLGDYEYYVLEDGTAEITRYYGKDSEIKIPEYINKIKVTSIGNSAFWGSDSIVSVTIPNGVTKIGNSSFSNCENLEKVIIPGSVKAIEGNAFSETKWLNNIKSENTFVIINGILIDATRCSGKVSIPNSVTCIAGRAFSECSGITDVTIPQSVKSIGDSAFYNCSSLKNISIPKSVTEFGTHVFMGTKWLENKRKENPLVIVNDIIIDGFKCTGAVKIPKSVKCIGAGAFDSSGITSINIPANIKKVDDYAFAFCGKLEKLTIANGVKTIGNNSFYYCSSLKDVVIPDSVTDIGGAAFVWCMSLKNIKLSKNIKEIKFNTFAKCSALEKISIPEGVTSIGNGAFDHCGLKSITIPKSVKTIGQVAFSNCEHLSKIVIPSSVKTIEDGAIGNYYNAVIYCEPGSVAEIFAKKNKISYKYTVELSTVSGLKNKNYTGKAIKQMPTVKVGGKTLKAGTDYTVTYKNNKAIGTATVTITGKGAYTGTVKATFKICPKKTAIKKVTRPKTKQLKVTYNKVAGVTGYQITYSTSSKFTKKKTKSVNVSGTSKTIKKLTKGKTYYVKVRTYKTVSGTKYYSGYTAVKKIKVK